MAALRRPAFVEPMKAKPATSAPSGADWLYEVKFDGFRVLAVKDGRKVELWSRNHKPFNERFPEVARAVAKLRSQRVILDGEVCALDKAGKSSFQLLQNAGENPARLVYYVFDVLFEGKSDLRELPLTERREHLDTILLNAVPPVQPSLSFAQNPAKILQKMREAGAEGAIAKQVDSVYEAGQRSGAWLKIKFHREQEFVVAGYTLPQKSRKHFGSLILGYYKSKRLIFAGHVGTGFSDRTLKEIHARLKKIEIDHPAVEQVQEQSGRWRAKGWKASECRWVKPQLVAQVKFTEWTADGILRHPSFLGLREDKSPREVVRE
jgi:bifunctional non-homologous end joining protein LigD